MRREKLPHQWGTGSLIGGADYQLARAHALAAAPELVGTWQHGCRGNVDNETWKVPKSTSLGYYVQYVRRILWAVLRQVEFGSRLCDMESRAPTDMICKLVILKRKHAQRTLRKSSLRAFNLNIVNPISNLTAAITLQRFHQCSIWQALLDNFRHSA
jgi:hypothetical protein